MRRVLVLVLALVLAAAARAAGEEPRLLTVKFRDGLRARAAEGRLVSLAGADLAAADDAVRRRGLTYEPLIRLPADELAALETRAASRSGRPQPDLAGLLVVRDPGAGLDEVARELATLDAVEWVDFMKPFHAPPCTDLPPPTPSYFLQGLQGYLGPDPGLDVVHAWALGAHGQGIAIADCEFGYIAGTEDLCGIADEPGQTVHPMVAVEGWDDHGTATLGAVVGLDNGYGITGIAPEATASFFMEWSVEEGHRRVTAIAHAIASVEAGDVVMLQMQERLEGATGEGPAEVERAVWTVTRTGSDAGVIVVAAAGNGNQDLDSSFYDFYRQFGDSGAILVGAGSNDLAHAKLGFSTFGSRVDLQGWGEGQFTLGYGNFSTLGGDRRQRYTATFGGTSAATTMVAGSAVLLQSLAEAVHGCRFAPADLRTLLVETGIPQGAGNPIGPFPDLGAAADVVMSLAGCDYQPICGNGVQEGTEPCDGADTGACPGPCTPQCTCASLTPGEAKRLRVTSVDRATGTLSITYRPACSASGNSVVYGRLTDVAAPAYAGEVCGIGNSGAFTSLQLGGDSYFFLVVANDGVNEGSYGTDSAGAEHPPFAAGGCGFPQDLSGRCDL